MAEGLTYSASSSITPVVSAVPGQQSKCVQVISSNAVEAWASAIGSDRVITDETTRQLHGRNAIGSLNRAGVLLRPRFADQVAEIVAIANRFNTSLHPISTGRNWGYGASSPSADGVGILDLSDLKAVRWVDRELGVIEIEPGVTQGMLHEFLLNHDDRWLTPVHGGGPDCSILGNALERGYGLTPTTDHFSALTSLEAVLGDGTPYKSPFHAMDSPLIGSLHRWGIGPYVEGLFSQGNFGIVTKATFTLARQAEHTEAFFIRLRNDMEMQQTVEGLRGLLASMPGVITGVNLMNDRRVLSMSRPYPVDILGPGEIIDDALCQSMTKEAGISRWTLAGVMHCPASMRRQVRTVIRKALPKPIGRAIHFNRRRVAVANSLVQRLPFQLRGITRQLRSIRALIDLADGIPRRVALPLAYWLRGGHPDTTETGNPAHDGCGLIWYSPLVPMKGDTADQFASMVHRVCREHAIEPLITLTSLSDRLFDSTVPILYRTEIDGECDRAKACYQALFHAGGELGCLPYRVTHQSSEAILSNASDDHFDVLERIRHSVDPLGVIAPGRYQPT